MQATQKPLLLSNVKLGTPFFGGAKLENNKIILGIYKSVEQPLAKYSVPS